MYGTITVTSICEALVLYIIVQNIQILYITVVLYKHEESFNVKKENTNETQWFRKRYTCTVE